MTPLDSFDITFKTPKKEGVAGEKGIGLSLYLQLMKYMGYIILMTTIMFVTPYQLKISHQFKDESQWVSSNLSLMAFFNGIKTD